MISWPALLARISLAHLRPPIRFVWRDCMLWLEWIVPDRETGKDRVVPSVAYYVGPYAYDCPETHSWLRSLLWMAAGHEVDENYLVDGRRIFDPHP